MAKDPVRLTANHRPFGFRDKLGYMFGDFGNDFTFILSTMILTKFYTDVMGVSAGVVGTIMMIARFVGDNSSPFFKTETFLRLLRRVVAQPDRFVVKQYNNRLSMTVRKIYTIAEGVAMLRYLASESEA